MGSHPRGEFHLTLSLWTGRACLGLIMDAMGPRRVHVPYYVCDALLEPLVERGLPVRRFGLEFDLQPRLAPGDIEAGEAVIIVNYFGLLDHLCDAWAEGGPGVVVDDTHAFFRIGSDDRWSFNSARKFFGVPDGAYLYGPHGHVGLQPPAPLPAPHLALRAGGHLAAGYAAFRRHEDGMDSVPHAPAVESRRTLDRLDYRAVAHRRRANFDHLAARLDGANRLNLPRRPDAVPLYYPLLPSTRIRAALIERHVFVPTLWPEVLAGPGRQFEWERELAASLCPLPIDQRYDIDDMDRLADIVEGMLV